MDLRKFLKRISTLWTFGDNSHCFVAAAWKQCFLLESGNSQIFSIDLDKENFCSSIWGKSQDISRNLCWSNQDCSIFAQIKWTWQKPFLPRNQTEMDLRKFFKISFNPHDRFSEIHKHFSLYCWSNNSSLNLEIHEHFPLIYTERTKIWLEIFVDLLQRQFVYSNGDGTKEVPKDFPQPAWWGFGSKINLVLTLKSQQYRTNLLVLIIQQPKLF